MTGQEAIHAKINECISLAEDNFKIKMPAIKVNFNLRGKASGTASCIYNRWSTEASDFELNFNREHIALGGVTLQNMIKDTVAHEIAHIVCFAFPQYGRAHDNGWKRVCLTLGGNGKRCYSDSDAPEAVAKQKPYVYTTNNGHEVRVSPTIHKNIQRGQSYTFRHGKGKVDSRCSYNYNSSVAPLATKPLTITEKVHAPKGKSKAELIRFQISVGLTFDECVAYGVEVLGMKRALAKSYVRNNWNK